MKAGAETCAATACGVCSISPYQVPRMIRRRKNMQEADGHQYCSLQAAGLPCTVVVLYALLLEEGNREVFMSRHDQSDNLHQEYLPT